MLEDGLKGVMFGGCMLLVAALRRFDQAQRPQAQ